MTSKTATVFVPVAFGIILALACTVGAQSPPAGLLTKLEAEHHDFFLTQAKAGNIDIVFFGDTASEMWMWPDRGKNVWNKTFGSLKAAGFGSQGTRLESLLWRMQNGELDGYRAKLVVLQVLGVGDNALADVGAKYADIIAEVRTRQPQARILIFAAFPRGFLSREVWRPIAKSNAAAVAGLVDEKNVFFADIGERFFLPDGSHNQAMWRLGTVDPGTQPPAFEVWAEELQPWLDRFVR